MNPILYLLYYFFKYLIVVSQRYLYARRSVVNAERGRLDSACIVVSNHPGTVLDPLNTAIHIHGKEIYFLANAGLFRNPVIGWLLRKLYCIPIERVQDTGGQPLNNEASFRQSSEFLGKGGVLYVAPEGSSFIERRLRKIKTGSARIAFAAEQAKGFQLGLSIQPVGLNYSDPTHFRSGLLTIFGEPIRVADFQQDWQADPVEAVRKLSAEIGERLSDLIIDTTDPAEDQVLQTLESVLQTESPLPQHEHFLRTKKVQSALREWKAKSPEEYAEFENKASAYAQLLRSHRLNDAAFAGASKPKFSTLLGLVLLFPIALLGIASHLLPVWLIRNISTRWLNRDLHWIPTFKYLTGLILLPLFYWLQIRLVHQLFDNQWITWAYALSLVPTGLVAEWWLGAWRRWRKAQRVAALPEKESALGQSLRAGLLKGTPGRP